MAFSVLGKWKHKSNFIFTMCLFEAKIDISLPIDPFKQNTLRPFGLWLSNKFVSQSKVSTISGINDQARAGARAGEEGQLPVFYMPLWSNCVCPFESERMSKTSSKLTPASLRCVTFFSALLCRNTGINMQICNASEHIGLGKGINSSQ